MARVQREYWKKRNQYKVILDVSDFVLFGIGLFLAAAGGVLILAKLIP